MDFIHSVKQKAKALGKSVIFPETFDDRTLKALEIILKEETCKPILVGNPQEIQDKCQELGLSIDWEKVEFFDLADEARSKRYADALLEVRKKKGMTAEKAAELMKNPNWFAVMAVQLDDVDAMVSGAASSTGETVLPALQVIKTKEKFHKVSGVFFMSLEKRLLLFADCAITIEPNSHDLADIAIDTAETAKRFGIQPRVAMLSFSTNGSAKHPHVDKVQEAVALIKDQAPDLLVEGEMQVDAALVPDVAKRKFPDSQVAGKANVLIFPDLQSGNIAYKLVERLAGARAIGPILQGLKKPINDLSRGCSVEDIADLAAFTACEAHETEYEIEEDNSPEMLRERLNKND